MISKPVASWLMGAGVSLALAASSAAAQTPIEHTLAPGRTYDPAVPAPTRMLGYALGQDLARYDEMKPYFERLAGSSRRVRLSVHGESYEGRPIYDLLGGAVRREVTISWVAYIREDLNLLREEIRQRAAEGAAYCRTLP